MEAAVTAIQALIDQELGPLIDQNRFRDRDAPRERVSLFAIIKGWASTLLTVFALCVTEEVARRESHY